MSDTPTARPGEISGFPKLNIRYRTDPTRVAALLPPGINPVDSPYVYLVGPDHQTGWTRSGARTPEDPCPTPPQPDQVRYPASRS